MLTERNYTMAKTTNKKKAADTAEPVIDTKDIKDISIISDTVKNESSPSPSSENPQTPDSSENDNSANTVEEAGSSPSPSSENPQTPNSSGNRNPQTTVINTNPMEELLIKVIEQEINNNNDIVKQLLLQRLAANNISYTRAPKPQNITELGGYYNLLSDAFGDDKTMSRQLLASLLGIPYIG